MVSAEGLAVEDDPAVTADDWSAADAAPPVVTELAETVYESGRPGRPYFEFVDGRLYEVLLEETGRPPSVRVVHEIDASDVHSFHASLKQIVAAVAAATLLLVMVLALAHAPNGPRTARQRGRYLAAGAGPPTQLFL